MHAPSSHEAAKARVDQLYREAAHARRVRATTPRQEGRTRWRPTSTQNTRAPGSRP